MALKEQYPVTAHAPNFEFWTGCREIKRWEESKRILKNPFASRLAGFNTTLKLLRIIDQWYIVPVKFRFGQNLDFLALLLLPLAGGPKIRSTLMPIEGLFLLLASIQAQIIVKGIRRNETATIETVRKKPLIHGCDWGDLVEGSFAKQNVLQRRVSKLLNESPYGRQNRTNRRYMFWKTSDMKSWYHFWLTIAMIHRVEIALLFISFKRLRLEREQIRQILLDLEQLTSDTSFKLENMFLKRAERDFRVARRPS